MKWQIVWAYEDEKSIIVRDGCAEEVKDIDLLLADGWEPFAVSTLTGAEKIWLRRIHPDFINQTGWTPAKVRRTPAEIIGENITQAYDSPR